MKFNDALDQLKKGSSVARGEWKDKNVSLYVAFTKDLSHLTQPPQETHRPMPWIVMRTADSPSVPWIASQTDMQAEDWEVVSQIKE